MKTRAECRTKQHQHCVHSVWALNAISCRNGSNTFPEYGPISSWRRWRGEIGLTKLLVTGLSEFYYTSPNKCESPYHFTMWLVFKFTSSLQTPFLLTNTSRSTTTCIMSCHHPRNTLNQHLHYNIHHPPQTYRTKERIRSGWKKQPKI